MGPQVLSTPLLGLVVVLTMERIFKLIIEGLVIFPNKVVHERESLICLINKLP
jgi:hypothetical protein